jgi:formylglycine-generating enzyme required for sulfatase activity/dienelactone hydrolase
MSSSRQDRVDEVFQAALDLPAAQRGAFLERACAGDQELSRAVGGLLRSHERAEAAGFLERAPAHRIGRFRLIERVGAGGMGEVFLAHDDSLDRPVALKLSRVDGGSDDERARRFRQEALAASALNHPNIVTVHEVGRSGDVEYMATEFVEGETLRHLLDGGALQIARALDVALQVAAALATAHAAGIVHRDVKPENVMVRSDGLVKVLDFGIAKCLEAAGERGRGAVQTRTGVIVGTAAYMSPEQARGQTTDRRTDVWSFGCLVYELLAGRPAFGGDTSSDTIAAVLGRAPDWRALPRATPASVRRLLERCLVKDPAERLTEIAGARALLEEALAASHARAPGGGWRTAWRRSRLGAATAALAAVLAGLGAWWWIRDAGPRWARAVALPEIAARIEKEDYYGAFLLARQAQRYLPANPSLERFWKDQTFPLTVVTDPPGADVAMKPYGEVGARWEPVGRTPFKGLRAPVVNLRLRITKDGFAPLEIASDLSGWLRVRHFTLDKAGDAPAGMVRVPGGTFDYQALRAVDMGDFWLDRYEVTNREYQEFVAKGGYTQPGHWKEPLVKDGRVLSWLEAMALFRDATGRPGPATWELGTYPEGQADHPVGGLSWFEAAAYAHFVGKELPTIYHWIKAAGMTHFADILLFSNFDGHGPAAAGSHHGLSPFGTYDMAGNVKEWCWNASGARRYILGGGWNEPSYMFADVDAQSPWDRRPTYGLRCAKYMAPPPPDQLRAIDAVGVTRHYASETPASTAVFRVYRGFYSYDKTALRATVESVQEAEHWRREKVSFDAAYGGERVPAYLFLPRNARPPYQTVVYWPSGEATVLRSSEDIRLRFIEFLLRSGRAVLHPVYKGTYERRLPADSEGPSGERDHVIQISKDLGRSLDYLETRPDIDASRLAYYGISSGAVLAPVLLAVERRFHAAVLQGGGLDVWRSAPEADPFNFAPRVHTPVLMVNGRYDFVLPLEDSQKRLLRLLGTPEDEKRHVVFETGHAGYPMHDLIKEVLDWLDRYLGPVTPG